MSKIEDARMKIKTYPVELRKKLEEQLLCLEQLFDFLETDTAPRRFGSIEEAERCSAAGKLALSQMGDEVDDGSRLVETATQFVDRAERWIEKQKQP